MKPKLVALISHPIQYYAPLYRELAARNNIHLHVVFLCDSGLTEYHDKGFGKSVSWDIPLLEGYSYTILEPGLDFDQCGFWSRHSRKLLQVLDTLDPDFLLIYGYASRMNWVGLNWAARTGRRVLYTSDSNANNRRSFLKNALKRFVVSRFFSRVAYFLSTSEANTDYLIQFGARQEDVIRAPFAIEYSRWSRGSIPTDKPREYHFAWAGKFVSIKRPFDFINALRIVSEELNSEVRSIFIGDGPLRGRIESAIEDLPTSCHVKLAGFVNQSDMPSMMQQADVFIFSSEKEAYGLIASEAAAAGLALIVADRIGCVGDTVLAQPGVNALVYPPGDIDALAAAMLKLIAERERCRRMQESSQEIARGHDISVAASIIEDLIVNSSSSQSDNTGNVSAFS